MQITLLAAAAHLAAADKIAITAHVNPDGDALGSALALGSHLTALGKEVRLLMDDAIPPVFSFLPGAETFCRPEAAYDADLLVVLDTSVDRIGAVREYVKAPVLNLDHHVSNDGAADYLHLDADKAATGEIVFCLLQEMGAVFTASIATCLYTAIATDCGFFRYSNTRPLTMEIGAELLRCGAKPNEISEALEKTPWATVMGRAEALQTLELFQGGQIAIAMVSQDLLLKYESTEGLIDEIRVIDDVDVAVVVKYVDDNTCRISMRSKHTNVSTIAMGFQGGGHAKAAGCTLKTSVLEGRTIILAAIQQTMGAETHG